MRKKPGANTKPTKMAANPTKKYSRANEIALLQCSPKYQELWKLSTDSDDMMTRQNALAKLKAMDGEFYQSATINSTMFKYFYAPKLPEAPDDTGIITAQPVGLDGEAWEAKHGNKS